MSDARASAAIALDRDIAAVVAAVGGTQARYEAGVLTVWGVTQPALDDAVVAAPAARQGRIRRISALTFRRRLSAERRAAITLAASVAMEGGDASIQVWLDDLGASQVVDLDDAETAAGIAALRAAGLVSEAERDALLADGDPAEAQA